MLEAYDEEDLENKLILLMEKNGDEVRNQVRFDETKNWGDKSWRCDLLYKPINFKHNSIGIELKYMRESEGRIIGDAIRQMIKYSFCHIGTQRIKFWVLGLYIRPGGNCWYNKDNYIRFLQGILFHLGFGLLDLSNERLEIKFAEDHKKRLPICDFRGYSHENKSDVDLILKQINKNRDSYLSRFNFVF